VDVAGSLSLGAGAVRALTAVALDRVADSVGAGLPRTPEALADPAVLNSLLHDHAPASAARLPLVSAARLPGVDFESSNCRNFLVELEFESDVDEAGNPVPRSLYAKLPCEDLATRVFANAVGFWPLECTFCERVAHHVPIRIPRVHAVARRGARFVLLLENLHELPGVRLFINRDMAAGTTIERARRVLSAFAELHAAFWGLDAARREALLPLTFHTFLSPSRRAMTRAMNRAAVQRAHRAAPDVFTREHAELYRLATRKWDALSEFWYGAPLTLIHGDSHLGNCFEYRGESGPRVGMLDFQGVQWCPGMRDVQYFLINSLEPALLVANEESLIDHYTGELARRGVALAPADAREQYRAFSFQTLMVGVVPLGMGGMTERAATLETVLRRGTAAIDRLGFADWLEAL
jgi:hypothetical protein